MPSRQCNQRYPTQPTPDARSTCEAAFVAALLACWSLCAPASEPDLKTISVAVKVSGELVTIDATLHVAASPEDVWGVLTDFDRMAEIVTNVQSSKVLSRSATTVVVSQQGKASAGPLTFAFETVREIELKPFSEIRARLLHGTMRKLEGTTHLIAESTGTRIVNHGEFIADVWIPPVIGPGFIEAETRKQYEEMRQEILRRSKLQPRIDPRGVPVGAVSSGAGAID